MQAYKAIVLAMRLRSLEEADQHVGAPGLALACKEARRMALAATTPVTVGAGAAWTGGVWGTVSRPQVLSDPAVAPRALRDGTLRLGVIS